jgi:hypothetical protein
MAGLEAARARMRKGGKGREELVLTSAIIVDREA